MSTLFPLSAVYKLVCDVMVADTSELFMETVPPAEIALASSPFAVAVTALFTIDMLK